MGYGFPFPVSLQPTPVLRACSTLVPGQPLRFWAERRRTRGCCCSVAWSHPTRCDPMNGSTPGFPLFHHLPEFAQIYIHWVSDAIQPSHPLSSPFRLQSFPASGSFPMSWLFASGGQSIAVSASASVLPMNIQGWFPLELIGWISLQSKKLSRVFFSTRGSGTGKQARARSQRHPHQTPETTQAPSLGTCLRSDSRTNLASAYLWFPSLVSPRGGSFLEMPPAQLPCLFLQLRVTWWMRQEKAPVWWADFPQDPRILSTVQWAGPWSEDVHTLILRTQGCSLTGKEEICRRDWGKGLEMRRASWTVQVVPAKRDLYL